MEPVIFDRSPLAEYLRDEGGEFAQVEWVPAASDLTSDGSDDAPPSPSPAYFPSGRPAVKARFRNGSSNPARVDVPGASSLRSLGKRYSVAVASSLVPIDNARFLEQFRYVIVASQLLSGYTNPGQRNRPANVAIATDASPGGGLSEAGVVASVLFAICAALAVRWLGRGLRFGSWRAIVLFVGILSAVIALTVATMRRRYLQHTRNRALADMSIFVSVSYDFDAAVSAAMAHVQEIELVSRGYRISSPLPPISRIEDKSQARKCLRLRKALVTCFGDILTTYGSSTVVMKGFSDRHSQEKYYDMYDVNYLDITDALRPYNESEFEDLQSLRTLKVLAARFETLRKLFLCALMALNAEGDGKDFLPWTTVVEAVRNLSCATRAAYNTLEDILREEQSFSLPPTPKKPLTPGRERWRAQLRKVNSLSLGIRGLQAKLQLMREESEKSLDESADMSDMVPRLMAQYDSIGIDLKELVQTWEEGKAALAQGIERNEKRLSSMSAMQSPTSSLSGLTTVEEGSAADALMALTGESPCKGDFGGGGGEEVFEAIAIASPSRPRSTLTRDERIAAMRDERERKAQAREQTEATRGMLRELEMVIKPRVRSRSSVGIPGRVMSM